MLKILLFISGALVLILELIGARILAPFVGTSIFVWVNLIGVVLGSLSLGYYFGGRLADNKPTLGILSIVFLSISVYITAIVFLKDPLLYGLHGVFSDIRLRSFAGATILFAVPTFLLGMIPPYIVKLELKAIENTGKTVGFLYAISTWGSIMGCFLTGLFLIPYFGSTKILLICACTTFLAFLLTVSKKHLSLKIIAVAILLTVTLGVKSWDFLLESKNIIDEETPYHRVWIYLSEDATGKPIKVMRLNRLGNSATYLFGDKLVAEYLKYYKLQKHFAPNFKKTLMIGGAGYSYPINYLNTFPDATIDVVEIDQGLTDLAKKHFRLQDDSRLNIHHEDGRVFLNETTRTYDVILIDAFKSISALPYQITTRQAVEKMHDILDEEGVVLMNIISSIEGKSGEFLRAEYATFLKVFPQVFLFPIEKPNNGKAVQNVMLAAVKSRRTFSFTNRDKILNDYLGHRWQKNVPSDMPILTDDHAPVEHYMGRIVF